jgi:outer membrane protein OmpA-like peptidoglycan-associated protein
MKQRIYTYYKGYLECQYYFDKKVPLGKRDANQQHTICLEPRFRFLAHEAIDENLYLKDTTAPDNPFIRHTADERVEFIHTDNPENTWSAQADEVVLHIHPAGRAYQESDGVKNRIHDWKAIETEVKTLLSRNTALPLNPFMMQKGAEYFGRFHGYAYCRTFKEVEIPNIVLPTTEKPCAFIMENGAQCSRLVDSNNEFCFQHREPIAAVVGAAAGGASFPGGGTGGPGTGRGYFSSLQGGGPPGAGCFPRLPFGVGAGGCFPNPLRWLAALGALLAGIALLALAWCYLFGNCSKSRLQPQTAQTPDTVYVEVFRELKDTLKIVQLDTVSMIDSTIKSTYEMVSLPNVQFFTDSDVLMPSSARELQQLADYLVKNPTVEATIIGHTDNTGNPEANLKLSQRRSESVKRFLESLGVQGTRLEAKGMGDRQPKADNKTEEGRLMNRRVEVQLITMESTETIRIPNPDKPDKPKP